MNYVNVLFFVGKESHSGGFWIGDVSDVERHIKYYYPKATDIVVTDVVETERVEFDDYIGERPFALAGSMQYINQAVNTMFEYDAKIEAQGRPEYLKLGEGVVVEVGGLFVLYY